MPVRTANTNTAPSEYLGGGGLIDSSMIVLTPVQVVGLVPVTLDPTDCRTGYNGSDYVVNVYSDGDGNSFSSDINSFFFEYPDDTAVVSFYLQKWNGVIWVNNGLSNDSLGVFYGFGDLAKGNWTGFTLEWYKIITAFAGGGQFRFRVSSTIFDSESTMYSEVFCLKDYSCQEVNQTTRFDMRISDGKIGSAIDTTKTFDFNGDVTGTYVTIEDSLRVKGFFGYPKMSNERMEIKYQNGQIERRRDEIVKKYEWTSEPLPLWAHLRLAGYAFRSDGYGRLSGRLLISDYNYNNSDYEIKLKSVICDSGYEPKFYVKNRLSKATKIIFRDAIENNIRTKC
jgi:hypothetical protein